MTNRALLLLAIFALFASGGALGFFLRRYEERIDLPPARVRSAEMRRRLEDHERRPERGLQPTPMFIGFGGVKGGSLEDQAEAALLQALSWMGTEGLEGVDKHYPGTHAAGRALWEASRRPPDGPRGRALLALFRERYPDAWVLPGEDER